MRALYKMLRYVLFQTVSVVAPYSVYFLTAYSRRFAGHLGCVLWSYSGKKDNYCNLTVRGLGGRVFFSSDMTRVFPLQFFLIR